MCLNDHVIEIIGLNRTHALLLEHIDEKGNLQIGAFPERITDSREVEMTWTQSLVNPVVSLAPQRTAIGDSANYLEMHGIYRGFAWYTAQLKRPQESNYQGFILQQASDVISLYSGESFLGTVTPGGTSHYLEVPTETPFSESLTARVEIWGHTNFHDTNLPALHLNSLKGLTGIVGVTSVKDLNQNWRFKRISSGERQGRLCSCRLKSSAVADCKRWRVVIHGAACSSMLPQTGEADRERGYLDVAHTGEFHLCLCLCKRSCTWTTESIESLYGFNAVCKGGRNSNNNVIYG